MIDAAAVLGQQHRADLAGGGLGELAAASTRLLQQFVGGPRAAVGGRVQRGPEPGQRALPVAGQAKSRGEQRVDVHGADHERTHRAPSHGV
jgi:hypothetical protein